MNIYRYIYQNLFCGSSERKKLIPSDKAANQGICFEVIEFSSTRVSAVLHRLQEVSDLHILGVF